MQIMVTGRAMGKTTAVIEMLKADPLAVLVVAHTHEAKRLQREYPELADQILSATSSRGLMGKNVSAVYVDNVDMLLHQLLGYPVTFGTVTAELVEPEKEWWEEVADIAAEAYTRTLDQIDGLDVSIHEKLAADVARSVINVHLHDRY